MTVVFVERDSPMITKEVCGELRVNKRTLYRYAKSRKLTYIKMDGRLLFERADVERFKEKRKLRAA